MHSQGAFSRTGRAGKMNGKTDLEVGHCAVDNFFDRRGLDKLLGRTDRYAMQPIMFIRHHPSPLLLPALFASSALFLPAPASSSSFLLFPHETRRWYPRRFSL